MCLKTHFMTSNFGAPDPDTRTNAKNIAVTNYILFILFHPLAKPNISPAVEARGMPTFDNVPEWVVPRVFETCVIASVTQVTPLCDTT